MADQDPLPSWLRTELEKCAQGEPRLPVLPDVACRVMSACQDARSDLRELERLVLHDQALAAHVLRVANSVAYAPKATIVSLRQAIGRLGLSTVSDVALALALKQRVFSVPGHESRTKDLWRHSAATAGYARAVAQLLQRNMESAFLSGLLHDVGMPLVMQAASDLARERKVALTPVEMEAAMDQFHGVFGARLAERWRLGPWVGVAILHHHDPSAARMLQDDVLVITLADALATWALDESQDDTTFAAQPGSSAAILGEEQLIALLGQRRSMVALASAFQ
jgi:putative nucleotidyltransferase with HDIG domain